LGLSQEGGTNSDPKYKEINNRVNDSIDAITPTIINSPDWIQLNTVLKLRLLKRKRAIPKYKPLKTA